jgi:hypothetical protein
MASRTVDNLLKTARIAIGAGEAHLHQAAEDIHAASEKGATQRTIADAVGKSASWVNGPLQWRLGGYDGTAFGPQSAKTRERIKSEKQESLEADPEPPKPQSKRKARADPRVAKRQPPMPTKRKQKTRRIKLTSAPKRNRNERLMHVSHRHFVSARSRSISDPAT